MKKRSAIAAGIAGLFVVTGMVYAETPETSACRRASWFDVWADRATATGDWGGARDRLRDMGVKISANYTTDISANVTGGLKRAGKYSGILWAAAAFDLEKIASLKGLTFTISNLYLTGRDISASIGSFYSPQQVFSSGSYYLGEMDLALALLDDTFVVEVGRLFAGDIFAVSPVFQYYMTSAVNGRISAIPSNVFFPHYAVTSWGVRTTYQPSRDLHIIAGLYNADPAMEKINNHGARFAFDTDEGYLAVGQITYGHHERREEDGYPGSVSFGTYYESSRFQDLSNPSKRWHGNYGMYAMLDQMIYKGDWPDCDDPDGLCAGASYAERMRHPEHQQDAVALDRPKGLTAWFSAALCPADHINVQTYEIATGLVYQGLPPSRDRDVTAFLVVVGGFSDELDSQSEEMVLELNHRFQATPWFYLTPDIQYIIHPDGRTDRGNALVLGFEACCTF